MKYQIVITEDGSPTLLWEKNHEVSEHMHHSGGALTESLYIYDQALEETLKRDWSPQVFSLGLGLGYNEMIALARIHKTQNWKIWSYEAIPLLQEGFTAWAMGSKNELSETYAQVAKLVAAKFSLSEQQLRGLAAEALSSGQLELRGAYPETAPGMSGVTCVFYDAYSKKMNPELWEEEELIKHLGPALAENCVFTTYAARGSLNRALRNLGFIVEKKQGFSGKRESTLAIRERP